MVEEKKTTRPVGERRRRISEDVDDEECGAEAGGWDGKGRVGINTGGEGNMIRTYFKVR